MMYEITDHPKRVRTRTRIREVAIAVPAQEGMSDFGVAVVAFVSFLLGAISWALLP